MTTEIAMFNFHTLLYPDTKGGRRQQRPSPKQCAYPSLRSGGGGWSECRWSQWEEWKEWELGLEGRMKKRLFSLIKNKEKEKKQEVGISRDLFYAKYGVHSAE